MLRIQKNICMELSYSLNFSKQFILCTETKINFTSGYFAESTQSIHLSNKLFLLSLTIRFHIY